MKLILLSISALALFFNSCGPTEFYDVTVYERRAARPATNNDPRAFIPKERF